MNANAAEAPLPAAPEARPNVRPPDPQNVEALLFGNRQNQVGARGVLNEDGMVIPVAMRNYREKKILCGFATLKRCERIDLCWGYFKDIERDFIYSHLFVLGLVILILGYILFSVDD